MMPSSRVIFINRFYWPEIPATAQLLTDLAEGLSKTHQVTVITSGPDGLTTMENRHGVEIVRVSEHASGRASLMRRFAHSARFRRGAVRWLKANATESDILVCMTDPPLIGTAMARVAREKKLTLIHWVQDIFPEVAVAVFGIPLLNVFRRARDAGWQAARLCVMPGEAMRAMVITRGMDASRTLTIPNWSPVGLSPAPLAAIEVWKDSHKLAGKFVVMYSGNFGRVHDFRWFVPLAKLLGGNPRVVFVLVGHGPRLAALQKEIARARLTNVRVLPPTSREDLGVTLSAADAHLVSLRAGCENLVFPSKLAGIAAVGRPALVVGPAECDPAREVTVHDWGRGFTADHVAELASTLSTWTADATKWQTLCAHARLAAQQMQFERSLAAWERILVSHGSSVPVSPTVAIT